MTSTGPVGSPLAVLRMDPDGRVVAEDALRGERRRMEPEEAMRALLTAAPPDTARAGEDGPAPDPVVADWIDNGWRPSLEYFLWSERAPTHGQEGCSPPPRAAPPAPDPRAWRALPEPAPGPSRPTAGQVLVGRRTARVFEPRELPAAHLAGILAAVYRARAGAGLTLRLLAYDVEDLAAGVWRVRADGRAVSPGAAGDFREEMVAVMCGMPAARTAAATLVFVADFSERQRAYPYESALRELYVELGRLGQHAIVEAEARNLGCLITPATNDRRLGALLELAPREYPVYTVTVGHRRPPREPGSAGA